MNQPGFDLTQRTSSVLSKTGVIKRTRFYFITYFWFKDISYGDAYILSINKGIPQMHFEGD